MTAAPSASGEELERACSPQPLLGDKNDEAQTDTMARATLILCPSWVGHKAVASFGLCQCFTNTRDN